MKKIPAKTADALDLIIEFATLGEYGLEYPEQYTESSCERDTCAGSRRRPVSPTRRSRPLAARGTARPSKTRADTCDSPRRPGRLDRARTEAGNPDFASALRPPRIQLSFTE